MKPGSGTGYQPWCSAGQPNYNKCNYGERGFRRDCATADGNCATSKYYWAQKIDCGVRCVARSAVLLKPNIVQGFSFNFIEETIT
ncbi:hypothetical protein ACLKA6_013111 [Drosophila palustris]